MDIRQLQTRLVAHGYKVTVDNQFGPETKGALSAFQKANGLPGSGKPGPKTYALLAAEPKAKSSPAPKPAVKTNVPKHMRVAFSYLGTKEAPGKANNPVVVKMFDLAGGPHVVNDSVPWCAAFVAACLAQAKTPNEARKSLRLWAAEYANVGTPLKSPVYGCIAVKDRVGGGHVGFVVAANERTVWLLGGNQGDAVSIASFPRFLNGKPVFTFRLPTGIDASALPELPTSAKGVHNPSQA